MTTPTPDWDAVIDVLNKDWAKGGLLTADGKVCLLGACIRAFDDQWYNYGHPALQAGARQLDPIIREQFADRVPTHMGDCAAAVYFMNDNKNTTLDDVILVCEKARAASPVL